MSPAAGEPLSVRGVRLRDARAAEAGRLTVLAMRSKAYWGYPADFMEACRAELAVSADEISGGDRRHVVAELDARVVGFYALAASPEMTFELDALFVDPDWIGMGIGRTLIRHALTAVAEAGGCAMMVQGDPNAEPFYRAVGGVPSGTRESGSIPGRFLPLFRFPVVETGGRRGRRTG